MKTMRFAVTLFTLLAWAVPVPASQFESQPQRMEQLQKRLQEIKDRLKLTPEQIEQVRPVMVEEVQQMKAVREKYGTGDQSRRTRRKMGRELRGIRNSADEKLKKILSKQQMDELKKMREEWRRELRERAARK